MNVSQAESAEQGAGHVGLGSPTGFRAVALILRFVLELALLAGGAVLGWNAGVGLWSWLLMVAVPLSIAVVWGLVLAEKPRYIIPAWTRLVLEALLFVSVAAILIAIGIVWPAIVGFFLWAADRLVLFLTRR